MKFQSGALACLLVLLGAAAQAAPIYNVDAGTVTYINNYLASSLGVSFTFTGPQPVNVQGGGGNNVGYLVLEPLNTPFNITLSLFIDDTGNTAGPASANGVDYGGSEYLGIGSDELTNSVPIELTPGNLTVSVPATVSGGLEICTPDPMCPGGATPGTWTNPFDVSFGPLAGTLTVTYAQFNPGSDYALTKAVFTTAVPEPATWPFLLCGIAVAIVLKRHV